jgi:DNA-binding Lrp family transcriptional regulator
MIDALDLQLIAAVQAGLPIASRPYAVVGAGLGLSEQEVIARLQRMRTQGLFKRWAVVVKHRQLGYRANAMIVLDVPDASVAEIGRRVSAFDCVNLCYRRPRQGDSWPFNLYCMIHGKSREGVLQQWHGLQQACGLEGYASEVLFSRRCFKQRGALYRQAEVAELSHG